jgi:hypothetical protein
MQSLEKNDVIKPIRIINPVKIHLPNGETAVNPDLKAIISEDKRVIFILKRSSKIISNEKVWDNIVPVLERRGIPYIVDPVNTYVTDQRLAMHIIFPDANMWDGKSKVSLSLWVYNSYDRHYAFKFKFGTYRWLCSNASYVGWKLLKSTHYKGDSKLSNKATVHFESALTYALKLYPGMQQRINELNTMKPTEEFTNVCIKSMGYKFEQLIRDGKSMVDVKTAYDLYCELTSFVTHYSYEPQKPGLYTRISQAFEL